VSPQKQPKDLLNKVFNEISVVKGHPRLIVLVGNGFLELLISILVKEKLKNGKKIYSDSRTYTYAIQLVMLHETGIITDTEYKTLDWYRGIRNRAAHEPIFEITTADLEDLGNPNYSEPDALLSLTINTITGIWNAYFALFTPLFGFVRRP
jgi:hypothetical protein